MTGSSPLASEEGLRPSVALFALGGTIAAPVDAGGRNASMTLTADEIVGELGALAGVTVAATTFRQVPSAGLLLTDVIELAAAAAEAVSAGASGVVVTLGTDSLEEVAFALDLLWSGVAPLVVTGAMRNAGLPGADGPANLLGALRVAAHPDASGQGVLVVMNDQVHLARFVRKAHSSSVAAFESGGVGPIGWLVEDRVRIPLVRRSRPRAIELPDELGAVPTVALLRLTLDDDPTLPTLLAARSAGVVVEVFGAGHVAARAMDALREAARTAPVVFASRTGAGELYRTTGRFPGSEQDLLDAGLLSAGSLDGPKSRILLSLLLAAGLDRAAVAARFAADADL